MRTTTTSTREPSRSPIRPIRDEAAYDAALREIERLWNARRGSDDADRLDVLVTLVEAYENVRHPVPMPDPKAAILFRLEQLGLDRKALIGVIGTRSRVHEVLTGARPFTLAMIRRLHERFGVPADILIQPASPERSVA